MNIIRLFKFKNILKSVAVVIGAVLALDLLLLIGIPKLQSWDFHADNAIVLGAAINTTTIQQRAGKALQLYEQGKVQQLILSGGKISPSDISEAGYMARYIKTRAKAPVNAVVEEESHNTYENIRNAGRLIDKKDPVVIVSDEFHLARAVLLAKRAGFETVYWAAPNQNYYSQNELRYYYAREFLALINYIPKLILGLD